MRTRRDAMLPELQTGGISDSSPRPTSGTLKPTGRPSMVVHVKELQDEVGKTGLFGEIFIGLGLLIGLFGGTTWGLSLAGFFDGSAVGAEAVRGDWTALGFLFAVLGLGFIVFGAMAIMAGWDRHRHPDLVH